MSLLLYFCPTLGEVAVGEHKGGNDGPKVEETADPRRRDIHPHGGVARGGARRRRSSPRVAPVREHAAPVARDEAHHRVELPRLASNPVALVQPAGDLPREAAAAFRGRVVAVGRGPSGEHRLEVCGPNGGARLLSVCADELREALARKVHRAGDAQEGDAQAQHEGEPVLLLRVRRVASSHRVRAHRHEAQVHHVGRHHGGSQEVVPLLALGRGLGGEQLQTGKGADQQQGEADERVGGVAARVEHQEQHDAGDGRGEESEAEDEARNQVHVPLPLARAAVLEAVPFLHEELVDAVRRVNQNHLLQQEEHERPHARHPNEAVVVEHAVGCKSHPDEQRQVAEDLEVPALVVEGGLRSGQRAHGCEEHRRHESDAVGRLVLEALGITRHGLVAVLGPRVLRGTSRVHLRREVELPHERHEDGEDHDDEAHELANVVARSRRPGRRRSARGRGRSLNLSLLFGRRRPPGHFSAAVHATLAQVTRALHQAQQAANGLARNAEDRNRINYQRNSDPNCDDGDRQPSSLFWAVDIEHLSDLFGEAHGRE
mmetsp:Transcript_63872/g.119828  ORF Transcript_63872/g.119828 Transcript_63872/m.119828 type:complete len:545 (+) Transcript_63872:170-1804(+)